MNISMPKIVCKQCNQEHQCNPAENDSCWCFKYPSLQLLHELIEEPFQSDKKCLCETCFVSTIKKVIDKHATLFKAGKIPNYAPQFVKGNSLIDDIDFYKENGNWVFTSWSHMKRGHCCGNGCRHCPYPKEHKK